MTPAVSLSNSVVSGVLNEIYPPDCIQGNGAIHPGGLQAISKMSFGSESSVTPGFKSFPPTGACLQFETRIRRDPEPGSAF